MGLVPHKQGTVQLTSCLGSSPRVDTVGKEAVSKPGSSSGSADTLTSGFPASRTMREKCGHFSLPVYCNLLYQPKPKYMVQLPRDMST